MENSELLQKIWAAHDTLPLPLREARALSLACAIEPLSEKPGCVTRTSNTPNGNTLEMFLAGAVNIFPIYAQLASYVNNHRSAKGMYQFFPQAVLLSKCQRLGGQINLGILEFSFPIVAAHILSKNGDDIAEVLSTAQTLVDQSDAADFSSFYEGKQLGREITRISRGKTYHLPEYTGLKSVKAFYEAELARERDQGGRPTGIQHNRQFVECFPTIAETFQHLQQGKGTISQRAAEAYHRIMADQHYRGIGPGLVADFVAIALYLEICKKREHFIE